MALINTLTEIGNAIREKTGGTELIPLKEMPQAILDISSGGDTDDMMQFVRNANQLFYGAKIFPSKAVVNLPNATTIYQSFSYWNAEPIPIVEELTVNAPKINVANSQNCMGQMFTMNYGVKKIILNMPDESQHMVSTFSGCSILEEIVLNFSTKNISSYESAFYNDKKLKKIIGVLDFSSATNVTYMFSNNNALEEVRFAPNTVSISISLSNSGKLTSESVQSIIDGLETVETAKTLTLSKSTVLTDEQKSTISSKGWTLVQ